MTQSLDDFIHFEKSIYKTTKRQIKSLRKTAKKARKTSEEEELSADQAREQLDEIYTLFAEHINTAAGREVAEARVLVDLVVGDRVLLEQVPPRLLVTLRRQVKRFRKAADQLVVLHGEEFRGLAERALLLQEAIERAVAKANQAPVDQVEVAQAVVGYLRGGD